MYVDRITYKDLNQIKKLQPEGWPDITLDFIKYINYDFCEPIKLTVENKIIGIGSSIIFKDSAWIAHVIIDLNYRKKGYGSHLVDFLINSIKGKKINSISLLATPFGESIYIRSGFKFVSDYIHLNRKFKWTNKKISKNIILYTSDLYFQLLKLDYELSGEIRENLIQRYLNNCLVYFEDKTIKGYYLPFLGEGAIYSQEKFAGLELMKVKYSMVDKAVIPSNNRIGINFLKQNGFIENNIIDKRMVFGNKVNWKPDCVYSRIGGNYG